MMAEAAAKDNSMEDILASIRKIISADTEKNEAADKSGSAEVKSEPAGSLPGSRPSPPVAGETRSASPEKKDTAPGSLSALAADMKSQVPSTSQPGGKSEATGGQAAIHRQQDVRASGAEPAPKPEPDPVNEAPGTPKQASPSGGEKPSAGSLAALARRVQTDIEPRSSTSAGPKPDDREQKTDAPAPSQPLRDLAARVATSEAAQVPPPGKTEISPDEKPALQDTPGQKPEKTTASLPGPDAPDAFREALVSPSTQSAVTGSMERLQGAVKDLDAARVEAVLRPLLKEWLDDNLPDMVERMVQAEISRIVAKQPDS